MHRLTRRLFVAAAAMALVAPSIAEAQGQTVRPFAQGGTVDLDLSAGEYHIVASADDAIRIAWRAPNSEPRDVEVKVVIRGTRAEVEIDGPHDNFEVEVQVPRRTHLVINLSAGELELHGVEGSKDVSVRAGEVRIGIGNREQYRRVDASVRIGELAARPFNVEKGGFFRSFGWAGKGQYDLRAHLTVGELRIED